MNLTSRTSLFERLRRGAGARVRFVESHLNKTIAWQIRATRERRGYSQQKLAALAGMNQNAISRLESASYGRPTITTLKRIAAALDVALVVRLVPYSQLADWIAGVPRLDPGLSAATLAVPGFEDEECATPGTRQVLLHDQIKSLALTPQQARELAAHLTHLADACEPGREGVKSQE